MHDPKVTENYEDFKGKAMTREEIREGIKERLKAYASELRVSDAEAYALTDILFAYLHSQGVVIKVDRELPKNEDIPEEYNELACGAEDDSDNIAKSCYELAQQDMLKAGYKAVKPLISNSAWDWISNHAYHSENIEPLVGK